MIMVNGQHNSPQQAFIAVCKDAELRLKSSSGGMFTLLAEYVIDDGGIVCGAVFDHEFVLRHIFCDTKEGLGRMRGSKYVESNLSDVFRQIKLYLDEGRFVLFSGVGCQIAGLRKFLGREYENLLLVEILCHGGALPRVWKRFIDKRREGLLSVDFRNKSNGWNQYSMALHYAGHTEILTKEKNVYMNGYFANLFLKRACYGCRFHNFSSGSDITLGDGWGANTVSDKPYCKDNKGVSLVFVNTVRGADWVKKLEESNSAEIEPVEWRKLLKYNPAITSSTTENKRSQEFLRRFDAGEDVDSLIMEFTRPSAVKRLEILLTPLLKALGIKGFTKKLQKLRG